MEFATLAPIAIQLLEALIEEYPAFASDISAITQSGQPTPEQWAALRQQIADGKYTAG